MQERTLKPYRVVDERTGKRSNDLFDICLVINAKGHFLVSIEEYTFTSVLVIGLTEKPTDRNYQ
jgi:hypothetical protein